MSVKKSVLLALLLVLSAACWAATEINGNKNIPDSIPIQEVHYQDGVPYYVTRMVPNVMDEYSGYTNNSRETITTRTVVSSRSWTIGTGGNFADINAAMADSRVVDGDVLKLTSGSVIIGTQTINKAIWLQGNGYRKDNNGNLEEDVARINGYLNISTDGIRISNLAMAMWPIEGESGSYHMPSIRVNAAYFVMEGCFVDGFISGYSDNATVRQSFIRGINGYEHGGWMIQNNIFATNSSNGYDLISKLINSTIDHNIIYSSFESKYSANYLISSISSCIISNNIIVHFPWDKDRTGTFNGTVESDCMTKNTVSHNVFTGSSPITNNKSGVNAIGDIFDYKKNTSSLYNIYKYDACFQLISNSPAKGYAIDGGDCGPWSGSYPYVIGGTVGGGGSAVNEKEAYAVFTDDGTLTFYYDNQKGKRSGTSYELNTGTNRPGWYDNRASITKAVFDVSFADARPTTTYLWFYEAKNLTSIEGIKNLNTSNVTDMSCMFRGCSSLISLDLSNFNTSNVTGMGEMFSGCSGLTSLNVSNFNTSNVTSMGGMFYGCSGLKSLDLSKFNTSKVKSMGGMFEGCSGLISLDVSSFNTSNVKSMYYMFDGCSGLISLDVSSFNTSNVVDMSNMFYNCRKLTSLDVSGFNTSSVTEMASMFYYCSSLKNLDVSGFNTGKVTNFVGFFMGCSSLISLDLSSFETRQAWNMNQMFCNCSSLTSINLSSFNTSNVMHMYCMFSNCSSLTSIDLSSFDTSKVTDMSYLFCNCRGLKSLDLSSFDTSNVTDMNTMFSGCSSLTTIYCGESWTTNNVTESKGMFYECIKLVGGAGTKYDYMYREKDYAHVDGGPSNPGYLTLKGAETGEKEAYAVYTDDGTLTFYYDNQKSKRSGTSYELNTETNEPGWYDNSYSITKAVFDASFADARPTTTYRWFYGANDMTSIEGIKNLNTSNVTNMNWMFGYCSGLTILDMSNFDTRNVKDMSYMFDGCSGLTSLDVSSFNTSNVTDMSRLFSFCHGLTSLNVSNFNTSNVTNMSGMFDRCSGLTSLGLSSFNTNNVTDMSDMFYRCSGLRSLDLSSFNTSNVTDMGCMFEGCSGLTSLDVSSFNTNKVTDMGRMFNGCSSLTSLEVSSFYTSNVTDMSDMFYRCSGLTSLDLSSFDTSNVKYMNRMFSGCSGLTSLDVSSFDTSNVTNMSEMFSGCSNLKVLDLSSFNTTKVLSMSGVNMYGGPVGMFKGCSSLITIYCGNQWNTENVIFSADMFAGCTNLIGSAGTKYNSEFVDKTYAHVDGGPSNPGYLTLKGGEVVDGDDLQRYLDSLIDTEDEFVNNVYRRVFLNDDWQALYVPFEMNYSDWADKFEVADIYGFYWYDDDEDGYVDRQKLVATIVESGSLQANFPYLIRAKSKMGGTLSVNVSGNVSQKVTVAYMEIPPVTYSFVGNYSQLTGLMSAGRYRLQGGSLFIPLSDSEVLLPYRWYMTMDVASTQSVRLNIVANDETTGIEDVKKSQWMVRSTQQSTQQLTVFDLSGRRVDADIKSLLKGIYLINGKKQIIK